MWNILEASAEMVEIIDILLGYIASPRMFTEPDRAKIFVGNYLFMNHILVYILHLSTQIVTRSRVLLHEFISRDY